MSDRRAMILAAGRGDRLRPLTDNVPKPLIEVGGKPLIVYLIQSLAESGIRSLVINASHLADQLQAALGDGSAFGVEIAWSLEPGEALETAGGVIQALPLLGEAPFALVNGDVWTDFPFGRLALAPDRDAHLIMVDNPEHHPQGDFMMGEDRLMRDEGEPRLTFSGISMLSPRLFKGLPPGRRPLAPVLRAAMAKDRVSGEHFRGLWSDVGTPERLNQAREELLQESGNEGGPER